MVGRHLRLFGGLLTRDGRRRLLTARVHPEMTGRSHTAGRAQAYSRNCTETPCSLDPASWGWWMGLAYDPRRPGALTSMRTRWVAISGGGRGGAGLVGVRR
jgi:hypothetical protein